MKEAAALFRLLGDEARLRLLRVLARDRFNVTELTGILGLAQSGISRHLGLLKDAGLVSEERTGAYSYYRLAPGIRLSPDDRTSGNGPSTPLGATTSLRAAPSTPLDAGTPLGMGLSTPSPATSLRSDPSSSLRARPSTSLGTGDSALWSLLESQFAESDAAATVRADEARLQEVLRLRRENFDAHTGPDTRDGRQLVPGRSWAAWSRALGHLMPAIDVVDIGCGEGYLTIETAQWARHVTAIDRSPDVLARAKALGARRRVTNVSWKRGDMEKLPLPDASVDLAVLSQALHHAADPAAAVVEAARVVRPGGHVLILELRSHEEAWVREQLGDRWLGFDDQALRGMLEVAQLGNVQVTVGSRRAGDPFTVLVASGVKERRRKPRT